INTTQFSYATWVHVNGNDSYNQHISSQAENLDPAAGSIQGGGGAFRKKEKAEEDQYFQEKTKQQLIALKKHHEDEIKITRRLNICRNKLNGVKQKIKKLKYIN
uniref:ATPase inhibitor, mitochondrial n=1 Tax=Castor canadensis TaxID=51338 RepID=A0A8C0W864_CASCN